MKKLSLTKSTSLSKVSSNNSHDIAMENISFEDAWQFIVKVGLAAHKYGSTATRIEYFLQLLSNKLGYIGVFRSTPSEITFALRASSASAQRVEIIEVQSDVNLDKLARLGELINQLKIGAISLVEATTKLDDIDKVKPAWTAFSVMFGYLLVGFGLPAILGGGWWDTLYATLLSIIVYFVVSLSARLGENALRWMPFSSAFIAAVLATLTKLWIPELNITLVVLSATAIILPGYTISLGVGELVAQHVISGITNLINGLSCMVKLILGGWLGVTVTSKLLVHESLFPQATAIDKSWLIVQFPLLMLGLCIVFQTPKRDLIWALLLSVIAYLAVITGNILIDINFGNLLGTIIAVILANLWAKHLGRPSSIVLIPAIVMLVSGSIGFRGLVAITSGELLLGSQQFLQMFIAALTLTVGIFIGHALVRPESNV